MKLFIYRDITLVGELFTTPQGVSFQYAENYVQQTNHPISLSLPLQLTPFAQKETLPFFDNLLPEEQQRIDLSKFLHTSATSVMRLLSALAGECVGNLTILSDDMDISALKKESSYRKLPTEELEALLQPQSSERLHFVASRRLSLAGAQAKLGLYKADNEWYATEGLAPTTHIIKPASSRFESLFANEFFMMQLAQACGLPTAATEIVNTGSLYALAIERFDRLSKDEQVIRLAQEDFCQALAVMSHKKYEAEGGPGLADLFQTTLLNTARPHKDILNLLRLVLFNYLIGNCDAHAKNFSLLRSHSTDALELAPAYDLISTTFYGDAFLHSMAMRIGQHSHLERITAADFDLFAEEVSISRQTLTNEMKSLCETITQSLEEVTAFVGESLPASKEAVRNLSIHVEKEMAIRNF